MPTELNVSVADANPDFTYRDAISSVVAPLRAKYGNALAAGDDDNRPAARWNPMGNTDMGASGGVSQQRRRGSDHDQSKLVCTRCRPPRDLVEENSLRLIDVGKVADFRTFPH